MSLLKTVFLLVVYAYSGGILLYEVLFSRNCSYLLTPLKHLTDSLSRHPTLLLRCYNRVDISLSFCSFRRRHFFVVHHSFALSLSLSLSLQLRIWFIVRRRASFCRSFYFTRHYRVSPLVLFLCWCVVFCEMFDWKYAIQWTKSTTYTYTITSKLLRLDRTQVYFRSQNFVVVWK